MLPKVTIFMPVYNAEQYIQDAIISVLNQSYTDFELLIINDGSTDNSKIVIESFKDKRIRLIDNNTNRGLPYTRNRGLELARGEYIALMDSDDIAYEDRIESQVKILEDNPQVDIVSTNCDLIIGDKIIKKRKIYRTHEETIIGLMYGSMLANPSVMFRKDTLLSNNLKYHEDYFVAQDYALWVEAMNICKFYHIPQSKVAYRTEHMNITKRSTEDKLVQRKTLIDKLRTTAIENNGIELSKEELNYFLKTFSDPILDITTDDLKMTKLVLKSMIKQNKKFNEQIFTDIAKYQFANRVIMSNLSFNEKYKLLNDRWKNESVKSYLFNNIRLFKSRRG